MDRGNSHREGQPPQLIRRLRQLGAIRAPDTILPTVLEQVGLVESYAELGTPVGPMFVVYNAHGVSAVMRAPSEADFEHAFRARFGRALHRVAELPARLRHMFHQHFSGTRRSALHLDLRHLPEFDRAVLLKAMQIPRGEVRPYAWVAREIGSPRALRAVGSALRRNPLPLLMPCHRVVRSDGSTGEYVFGTDAKRAVLAAEGVDVEGLEALARSGTRFFGSDTTHVYCFPTCRNARRITARHRVPLSSMQEAAAAGYRPCQVCRPARAS
jgi:O-6-methylguanine DNA methyltransferase